MEDPISDFSKCLCRVLLLVYLLVLLQTALFSREPGSRYSLDLTLFESWGRSAVSRAYFIENILMYLPFGILAPACFRKLERPWVCVLTAFASSVLLEWIQLLTHRGYCQLDRCGHEYGGSAGGLVPLAAA